MNIASENGQNDIIALLWANNASFESKDLVGIVAYFNNNVSQTLNHKNYLDYFFLTRIKKKRSTLRNCLRKLANKGKVMSLKGFLLSFLIMSTFGFIRFELLLLFSLDNDNNDFLMAVRNEDPLACCC